MNSQGSQTYLADASCVTSCPSSFYGDDSTATCIACGDGIESCSSSGNATTCGNNKNGDPTFLLNGTCVTDCGNGQFGSNGICQSCSDGATKCSSVTVATQWLVHSIADCSYVSLTMDKLQWIELCFRFNFLVRWILRSR